MNRVTYDARTLPAHAGASSASTFLWDVKSAVLAMALYVPTLFFGQQAWYIVAAPLALILQRSILLKSWDLLLAVFLIAAFANQLLGGPESYSTTVASQVALVLVPLALFAGRVLDKNVIKWLLVFLVIETATLFVEASLGIRYLFSGQGAALELGRVVGDTPLLYARRAFGLSLNSSVVSEKIFLGILLVFSIRKSVKTVWFYPLVAFLAGGLVVSFARTALVALVVFLALKLASGRAEVRRLLLLATTALIAVVVLIVFREVLLFQFARGTSPSELLAGRFDLWTSGLDHLRENPLFGNGSTSFRVLRGGLLFHLHSSFLQIFADHGLLIGGFWLLYVAGFANRANVVYVVSIAAYSLANYFIFWDISYADIAFGYFLFMGHHPSLTVRLDARS